MLNRRTLGVLSLGAALSACGGGGSDDVNNAEESFSAEVVASDWSDRLPELMGGIYYTSVGASGFIYIGELFELEPPIAYQYKYRINKYKADGTLVRQIELPYYGADSSRIHHVSVVEVANTNDIIIAVAYGKSVSFNLEGARGGFISYVTPESSQIIFESASIAPAGLARDKNGTLYFMDMKMGDILKLPSVGVKPTVIYYNPNYPDRTIEGDFPFVSAVGCKVELTDDGTIYAYFHKSSSGNYKGIVRLRNGQADVMGVTGINFGTYGNSLFVLTSTYVAATPNSGEKGSVLIHRVDAAGQISTVAGTPEIQSSTQFGSPGVLGKRSRLLGLTPDGLIHLSSGTQETPRFYSVRLSAQK